MKLPIGYDNFGAVIEQKLDFVDKSLFIKEILEDNATQVAVITRPRRFGKTLNLSMLHYFLAAEINGRSTKGLFDHLKIAKENNGKYFEHQGQYPVIFLTFKGIKDGSFKNAYDQMIELMVRTYNDHGYLLESDKLTQSDKEFFKLVLDRKVNEAQLQITLFKITEYLFKYYRSKVWLLIDEYDTPIQSGYLNKYYDEIISLIRGMFGAALKTNDYLNRAVITGILRVSKESIFSDINNLKVYSLLSSQYSQYFGFTEKEVADLLVQANLREKAEEIKNWYNGYRFGNTIIYNPWSIANCINENGALQSYWVNTSENTLIKNLLIQSKSDFKALFESLLQGQPIEAKIDENMVFGDLEKETTAALSLMLLAGYLKVISSREERGKIICQLDIPNVEVRNLYYNIIEQWLANGHGLLWYNDFLEHLLSGNISELEENLKDILLQTVSVHDTSKYKEAFYHGLMLGLAASLDKNKYELKSNRESGLGRYDIAIMPKDILKPAIILELKSITTLPKVPKSKLPNVLEKLLAKEAKSALKQINQKQYIAEMTQRGFKKIIKIGLAFSGKEFKIVGG